MFDVSEAPVLELLDEPDAPVLELERELEVPEVELLTPSCCAVSESSLPVTLMFLDC